MDSKVVAAFVGGLILASGITYIAVKPDKPVQVQTAPAAVPAPVVAAPAAAEAPAPEAAVDTSAPPPKPWRAAEPSRRSPVDRSPRGAASRSERPAPATPPAAPSSAPSVTPAPTPAPTPTASNTPPPTPAQAEAEANPEPRPYMAPKIDVPPPPNKVTIPSGTVLTVRMSETLSTEKNQPGDQFTAVLDQPLVVDGFVLAERGARAQGKIVELERSGKVKGLATLSIELTQVRASDGQSIKLNTGAFKRQADPSRKKDATKVGVGAAIGAAIGAIAGGGKGAAIGAGVGGAAGAGQVALSRGEAAELPVETRVSFRLAEAVTVTERSK